MPHTVKGALLLALIIMSGCSSFVEQEILSNKSYKFDASVMEQYEDELALEKRMFCIQKHQCFPYIYVPRNTNSKTLKSTIRADFTGTAFESSLSLQRNELSELNGNVLIIHGFRASKEWMVTSALYFRFLGLNVYLVDLLGHGENTLEKGFGVLDIPFMQQFVMSEIDAEAPLYLVGNSMGSLPALALTEAENVKGLILQAPMIRFDLAVPAYVEDSNAWYSPFLPSDALQTGAEKALQFSNIETEATDISNALRKVTKPTLIFSSNIDNVSPYRLWKNFESENVQVIQVNQRQHAYMSMIGQDEHQAISNWLQASSEKQ